MGVMKKEPCTKKILLVSPLPPPASGIATWTDIVLSGAGKLENFQLLHLDTAVRWRSTNDVALWKRLTGGTMQALRDVCRVCAVILKEKPAVIHLCTSGKLAIPKDILILFLSKVLQAKSVYHYHRGDLHHILARGGVEHRLMQAALARANTVILLDKVSHAAIKVASPGIETFQVPNPIDLECFPKPRLNGFGKKGAKVKVAFVGWVIPTKGVTELVTACSMLDGLDVELSLIGNVMSAYQKELATLASRRNNGDWIKFYGMMGHEDAVHALNSADIFVLPSYTEGFPNVVLEAMALGKPIIATRVGAIPEMLGEGSAEPCGLLVDPKDWEGLRGALLELIQDPSKAHVYGSRALKKVISTYAKNMIVERYASIWSALSQKG
ncbi:MAG TPA: glycosyltransferase family 4 protein [Geomonas sp.]|nr:glycosyltransferase family 4 protein [Geomonas sp.]